MSANSEDLQPPLSADDFESLCLDLWREIWGDPNAQKNGRSGQKQAGVDVYGKALGRWIGVQCKTKKGRLRSKVTVDIALDHLSLGRARNVAMVAAGRSWRSWKNVYGGLPFRVESCPL